MQKPLIGLTFSEIQILTKELNFPSFTAKQIADWLYKKQVKSIEDMSNLSKENRLKLQESYSIGLTNYQDLKVSKDGTKKYLFPTPKGNGIETAFIPNETYSTMCLSTQVGCKMGCLFCMTGKQGFQAQLSCNEILNQIQSSNDFSNITNLVYMGMGEPLDNYDELMKSIEIITSAYGYAWSPKRITVSTIGIIPTLIKFLAHSKCNLAISLHSPFAEERLQLMPIQNIYPITDVIEVLKSLPEEQKRKVLFEYIMFDNLNDTKLHVNGLAKLLNGIPAQINLMRFHSIPNSPLKGSSLDKIKYFQSELNKKGFIATIRSSRGEDIYAACGLLSTLNQPLIPEQK